MIPMTVEMLRDQDDAARRCRSKDQRRRAGHAGLFRPLSRYRLRSSAMCDQQWSGMVAPRIGSPNSHLVPVLTNEID